MTQRTVRLMTDWGYLSVVHRQGYYYAIKTVKGVKRQVYLGSSIPCQERLEEVASEINLSGMEWIKRHHRPVRSANADRTDIVSESIERLRLIEGLAKARGEHDISKQLSQVIRDLTKGIGKQR